MSDAARRTFELEWIAACAAAECIGIGSAGAVAIAASSALGEPTTLRDKALVFLAMITAGAIEGLALGTLQWSVLEKRLPRLRPEEWIGPTVAIAIVGWGGGMGATLMVPHRAAGLVEPPPWLMLLGWLALGAAAGVIFGAVQWVVLRRHARRSRRWIAIHVPAWALAMGCIGLAASLPDASWPPWAIAASALGGGLLGGALLGWVTAPVAARLTPLVDTRSAPRVNIFSRPHYRS